MTNIRNPKLIYSLDERGFALTEDFRLFLKPFKNHCKIEVARQIGSFCMN